MTLKTGQMGSFPSSQNGFVPRLPRAGVQRARDEPEEGDDADIPFTDGLITAEQLAQLKVLYTTKGLTREQFLGMFPDGVKLPSGLSEGPGGAAHQGNSLRLRRGHEMDRQIEHVEIVAALWSLKKAPTSGGIILRGLYDRFGAVLADPQDYGLVGSSCLSPRDQARTS